MSNTNSIGLQTFNTAFPLDFVLQNQYQDAELSVLYIVDDVDTTAKSQQIKVAISASSESSYSLKGFGFSLPPTSIIPTPATGAIIAPSNSSFIPDDTQYNLALALRPGTLKSSVQESFSAILYNSITNSLKALSSPNSCVVNGPIARKNDGALVWYVAFEKDLSSPIKKVNEWAKTTNTKLITNLVMKSDGSLLAITDEGDFYKKASVTEGSWETVTASHKVSSIALNSSGVLTVVRSSDNCMYTIEGGLDEAWTKIPNSAVARDISILANERILSTGDNGDLYYFNPSADPKWVLVPTTTKVSKLAARPDGSIVGIGKDDSFLYQRSSLENSQWVQIDNSTPLSAITIAPDGSILACNKTNSNFYKESPANNFLNFTLEGVSAAAGSGARSSQIELLFGNVSVNASANPLAFKRSAHIDIVNHEGHGYAPLYFGVLGDGTLLNKEGTPNSLSIYFQTTNGKPIQLNPKDSLTPTKIDFAFSYSPEDGETELMTFGNKTEVAQYELKQSGKYPLDTSGLATDDGEGYFKISGEFKHLNNIQQTNNTSNASTISESKSLYMQTTSGTDKWEILIQNAEAKAKQLAAWINGAGGPMQTYAGGKNKVDPVFSVIPGLQIVCFETDSNGNPKAYYPFNFVRWQNVITGGKYSSPATANWDTLPAGITSTYDSTDPWEDTDFLLYVIDNFSDLVDKIYQFSSSAFTGQNDIGWSMALMPCKAVYEIFRTYYDLDKALLKQITTKAMPAGLGSQELAERFVKINKYQAQKENNALLMQIGNFYTSSGGPVLESVNSSASYEDILNNEYSFNQLEISEFDNNTFNKSTWLVNNPGNSSNTNWDQLPPGITINFDVNNPWGSGSSGNEFYNYVKSNYNFLLQKISATINRTKSDGALYGLESLPIIPSKAIAAFLNMQFKASTQLAANISSCMIDITTVFAASEWDSAFVTVIQEVPSGATVLSASAIENKSQVWDDGFVAYLTGQTTMEVGTQTKSVFMLQKLTQDFSPIPIEIDNVEHQFIIPSQSLYDYLKASYENVKMQSEGTGGSEVDLYKPSSYVFEFNSLQISGSDGIVTLDISIQNLPGYWDTTFQVPIRKSKSILEPTLKLGHSGQHGRIQILATDPKYNSQTTGLTPGSRIDFLSGGEVLNQANVSIEEYYGLNLIGKLPNPITEKAHTQGDNAEGEYDKTGQPVRVKHADFLVQDGRLGIGNIPQGYLSGDFSNSNNPDPNEKLRVVGNSYLNGQFTTSGNANINGSVNVQGSINVQGNIEVSGRLNAPNLVPIGTIYERIYNLNNNAIQTAHNNGQAIATTEVPDVPGWLYCNGAELISTFLITKTGTGTTTKYSLNQQYLPLTLHFLNGATIVIGTDDNSTNYKISNATQIKSVGSGQNEKFYFYDPVSGKQCIHSLLDKFKVTLPSINVKQLNIPNDSSHNNVEVASYVTPTDGSPVAASYSVYLIKY